MPSPRFQKGNPGRPKGTRNKVTKAFRDAVLGVFDKLGGEDAMLRWAKRNQTEFYKLAARLIPNEVRVTERREDMAALVIERVDARDELSAVTLEQQDSDDTVH